MCNSLPSYFVSFSDYSIAWKIQWSGRFKEGGGFTSRKASESKGWSIHCGKRSRKFTPKQASKKWDCKLMQLHIFFPCWFDIPHTYMHTICMHALLTHNIYVYVLVFLAFQSFVFLLKCARKSWFPKYLSCKLLRRKKDWRSQSMIVCLNIKNFVWGSVLIG